MYSDCLDTRSHLGDEYEWQQNSIVSLLVQPTSPMYANEKTVPDPTSSPTATITTMTQY